MLIVTVFQRTNYTATHRWKFKISLFYIKVLWQEEEVQKKKKRENLLIQTPKQ